MLASPARRMGIIAGVSVTGAAVGGLIIWQLRSRRRKIARMLDTSSAATAAVEKPLVEIKRPKEGHEFSVEVETDQVEVMIQLLQKLQTGSTANAPAQLTTKLISLLHEYRRGLADKVWLSNRQVSTLGILSETLASGISSIERESEESHLWLKSLAEELEKVLLGGRVGRRNVPSSQTGNPSTGSEVAKPNSDTKSASGCKPESCGSCSNSGCKKSAPPDVKKLLMDCRTSEQRWTLRNQLIDLEINTLMAQSPNLYSIPESRKAEIRKRVDAAMEAASAEIHNDMITPGGGRASNQVGTLLVNEDGSLRISADDD